MGDSLRQVFNTIDCVPLPDNRTTAQRLADVLSESHREDTSADFRLGLLQGALAVALPELLQAAAAQGLPFVFQITKPTTKTKTKRSRRNA